MEESQKDYKICPQCKGRGELTVCCEVPTKLLKVNGCPVLPACGICKIEKPKTFECSYCDGCGEEPVFAERDREEDARESYLEALRDE
jgi:hypothetical protein